MQGVFATLLANSHDRCKFWFSVGKNSFDSPRQNGFLAVLVDVTTTRTTYTLNGAEIVFDVVWYDQGSRTSDTLGDPAHTIGEVLLYIVVLLLRLNVHFLGLVWL
eukprot:m.480569 g.480569  ORF g.480569 m.480569 type:complete len:105 (+) comp21707_c0_seq40:850-1164(+)